MVMTFGSGQTQRQIISMLHFTLWHWGANVQLFCSLLHYPRDRFILQLSGFKVPPLHLLNSRQPQHRLASLNKPLYSTVRDIAACFTTWSIMTYYSDVLLHSFCFPGTTIHMSYGPMPLAERDERIQYSRQIMPDVCTLFILGFREFGRSWVFHVGESVPFGWRIRK
jgi:hypothetical protein